MKFQANKKNYSVIVRKSYYKRYPDGERELVPGLKVRFVGPQRIFDSELAQAQHEWDDKDRKHVENWLLRNKRFNHGIYLAPGETLTPAQMKVASSLPAAFRPRCQQIWTEGTEIHQCPNDATAGREFCADHDPKQPTITRGLSTTAGASIKQD
jgi:hypothetical protein